MRAALRLLLALGALSASASCLDPVHQDAVDALGDEPGGGHPGPTHRPGQPCLTCHGGHGPGDPEFSIAGTVYAVRGQPGAAPGITVSITDLNGTTKNVVTNSAGNFYIGRDNWSPVYPLSVSMTDGTKTKAMFSHIGGDGSCATCHRGGGDNRHMPAVYFSDK